MCAAGRLRIIYSLVVTAKANGLDPWQYLLDVLTKAPLCETDADFAKLISVSEYFEQVFLLRTQH